MNAHAWTAAWLVTLALWTTSCRGPSVAPRLVSEVEADDRAGEVTVIFKLGSAAALASCSAPTLHGLGRDGAKLWSREIVNGEVGCSAVETAELAEVRIDHPHLALRQALRFGAPPNGTVRLDYVFFGNCRVEVAGVTEGDVGALLVLRRIDRESYLEASFNGRAQVLDGLGDLAFERLPVGRYGLGLFREDPLASAGQPYLERIVSVRPCQEAVVGLFK